MENNNWALGDSLMVKPGITEKITGENLSGWQGRCVALSENGDTLTIQLDSITLKNIPPAYIAGCEEWGVSWSFLQLAFQDVLRTTARDREEDVPVAIAAVETRYSWLSLGEQGERIRQIINHASMHNLFVFYEIWQAYLQEHLTFPFVAIVVEAQRGPIPQNAEVIVTEISLVDDTVGIVVRIRIKRRVYHIPLCELRAINATAELKQLIDDYTTWFRRYDSVYAHSPLMAASARA